MLNWDLLPFIIAMFFAMNMGASGVAPSFSCTYGANILSREIIHGIYGVFVFIGAIVAGGNVIKTISCGFVPPEIISFKVVIIILVSCSVAMFMANLLKIPQSTSQATVFAFLGVGLFFSNLKLDTFFFMIPMWFVLPIISFVLTYIAAKIGYKYISINGSNWETLINHPFLKLFVILTSCYVAFSIGSNNVANAAGPLVGAKLATPLLGVLIIAPCFGIGSSLLGHLPLETTSKEITSLNPISSALISLITGTLLLAASFLGIPQSLVQLNVGSIAALSCSRIGCKETLKTHAIKKSIIVWIVAPIIAFILAYVLCFLFAG